MQIISIKWFLFPDLKIFKTIESTTCKEFEFEVRIHNLGCCNGNLLDYLIKKHE